MTDNKELINNIKARSTKYLDNLERDAKVLAVMQQIDRINFLPESSKQFAYIDTPVSIGYNQTCSQPSMVAFMLDKLSIKAGNKILEIGAGCGYAAAIASELCKPGGVVFASEIVPELASQMKINLAYYNNIEILSEDGSMGFPDYAPFDRIILSAGVSSKNFDEKILLDQLTNGGILLYPENYGNIYLIKKNNGDISKSTYYGVSFVSLRGRNS